MFLGEWLERRRQRRLVETWIPSLINPSEPMVLMGEPADKARLTLSLADADRYMRGFADGQASQRKDLTDGLNLIKTYLVWGLDLARYKQAVESWKVPDNSDLINGAKQHDPPIWVVISPGGPVDAFTQTMPTSHSQVIVFSEAMLWLADRLCCLIVTTGSPEILNTYVPDAVALSDEQARADFRNAVAAAESGTFLKMPAIQLPEPLSQVKSRFFEAMCWFMVAHELAHLFLGHQKFGQRHEFPREKFPNIHARHFEEYNADWLGASMVVHANSEPEVRELAIWGLILVLEVLHQIEEHRGAQNNRQPKRRRRHASHPHPVFRRTQAITYVQQDAFPGEWNVGHCDYLAAALMNITGSSFGEVDSRAMDKLVDMSDADVRKRIVDVQGNKRMIAPGSVVMDLQSLNPLIDESLQSAIVTVASAAAIYIGYIRLDCWVISGVSQLMLAYLYSEFRARYIETQSVTAEALEFEATLNAGIPHLGELLHLMKRGVY